MNTALSLTSARAVGVDFDYDIAQLVDTPQEALDAVAEQLLDLDPQPSRQWLDRDTVMQHLNTLARGYHCRPEELPEPLGTIAITAQCDDGYMLSRGAFIDLLWQHDEGCEAA